MTNVFTVSLDHRIDYAKLSDDPKPQPRLSRRCAEEAIIRQACRARTAGAERMARHADKFLQRNPNQRGVVMNEDLKIPKGWKLVTYRFIYSAKKKRGLFRFTLGQSGKTFEEALFRNH